jgi:hypothetical protein
VTAGILAIAAQAAAPASTAATATSSCELSTEGADPIATARLYIEYNATDLDVGVHGMFDDDGWSELCVTAPDGRPILVVRPRSQLGDLTVGALSFESREPPTDELAVADLERTFPEGSYTVRARAYDGRVLSGEATFTHDIPTAPVITSPTLAGDAEGAPDAAMASAGDVIVTWEPVTTALDGSALEPSGYEVIVTKEVEDDPHGFSRPMLDVHLPPDTVTFTVAEAFLERATVYELEVLALEPSGNQTITAGFFSTP